MSATPADVLWLAEVIGNVRIAAVVGMFVAPFLWLAVGSYWLIVAENRDAAGRSLSLAALAFCFCAFFAVMLPSEQVTLAVLEARR